MKKLLKEKFIFEHELYAVKQGRDQMKIPAFLLEKCVVYNKSMSEKSFRYVLRRKMRTL